MNNYTLENLFKQKTNSKIKYDQFLEKNGKKLLKTFNHTNNNNIWDFVILQIGKNQQRIINRKKSKISELKRCGKIYSKYIIDKYYNDLKKEKEEKKEKKDISRKISSEIYKSFWFNCFKINKEIIYYEFKEEKKEFEKKKIEDFIKKQLNLSKEISEKIIKNDKEINYKDDIIIILNLKKTKLGYKINKSSGKNKNMKNHKTILFKGVLRNYQNEGLNWMAALHDKNSSGIWADEMGLGKTVQTLAFLSYLAEHRGIWGPHLIIVPTSVLGNWYNEAKRFLPGFKVFLYNGRSKERKDIRKGWSQLDKFNICLTTYRIVTIDIKIFVRRKWYVAVLDEAHWIKNIKTITFESISKVKSIMRILLTGTPIQNDLMELWSLLHFIFPNKFKNIDFFNDCFRVPVMNNISKNKPIHNQILKNLHSILRPLILRRLKKEVESELPKKIEKVIMCKMSRRQKFLYDEYINNYGNKSDFIGVMNTLLSLRKICNHPNMIEERGLEMPIYFKSVHKNFNLPKLIKSFSINKETIYIDDISLKNNNVIQHFLSKLLIFKKNNKNVDIYVKKFKFMKYIRDVIPKFNNIKLSFKKPISIETPNFNKFYISKDSIDNRFIPYFYLDNLVNFFIDLKDFVFLTNKIVIDQPFEDYYNFKRERLLYLRETNKLNSNYNLYLPSIKNFIYDSGKLNKLIYILRDLKKNKHKILLFTQMSKTLDILEKALAFNNYSYLRIDGSVKAENRQRRVDMFNNDPNILIFLSSTRVGGIGLNLTGADYVIFYDSDWNPAADKQAQDRCHRIGQTKNVTILRLITKFSIEENILMKSRQKSKLDGFVLKDGEFTKDNLGKNNINSLINNYLEKFNKKSKKIEIVKKIEDDVDLLKFDNKNNFDQEETPNDEGEDNIDEEEENDDPNNKNKILKQIFDRKNIKNLIPKIYLYGVDFLQNNNLIVNNNINEDLSDKNDKENINNEENDNYEIKFKKPDLLTWKAFELAYKKFKHNK